MYKWVWLLCTRAPVDISFLKLKGLPCRNKCLKCQQQICVKNTKLKYAPWEFGELKFWLLTLHKRRKCIHVSSAETTFEDYGLVGWSRKFEENIKGHRCGNCVQESVWFEQKSHAFILFVRKAQSKKVSCFSSHLQETMPPSRKNLLTSTHTSPIFHQPHPYSTPPLPPCLKKKSEIKNLKKQTVKISDHVLFSIQNHQNIHLIFSNLPCCY